MVLLLTYTMEQVRAVLAVREAVESPQVSQVPVGAPLGRLVPAQEVEPRRARFEHHGLEPEGEAPGIEHGIEQEGLVPAREVARREVEVRAAVERLEVEHLVALELAGAAAISDGAHSPENRRDARGARRPSSCRAA
jgi:hypothetical protein